MDKALVFSDFSSAPWYTNQYHQDSSREKERERMIPWRQHRHPAHLLRQVPIHIHIIVVVFFIILIPRLACLWTALEIEHRENMSSTSASKFYFQLKEWALAVTLSTLGDFLGDDLGLLRDLRALDFVDAVEDRFRFCK